MIQMRAFRSHKVTGLCSGARRIRSGCKYDSCEASHGAIMAVVKVYIVCRAGMYLATLIGGNATLLRASQSNCRLWNATGGEVVKGTRRLEIVSEGSSGEDPEIGAMHVMATNAPHELDRVNLDAKGRTCSAGSYFLSLQFGKLCGVVSFRNGEDLLVCGRRRDGGKTGGHLRHLNQGVKQPDDCLGSMRKKQSI